jgi:hypothetical protein
VANCDTVGDFWVCYEVLGKKLRQGPYRTQSEADGHAADIRGFEGVGGCWVTDAPPAEYVLPVAREGA